MRLAERFVVHVRAARLLAPGERVLVACSGGADSTALLRLLVATRAALGVEVAVGHLDHGLREGSRDDARWVEALAAELGVPFLGERRRVPRRRGASVEAEARRVRYAFLRAAAAELGCGVVATAHHLDDQAETVLYRALRGTGVAGLRGIRERARLPRGGPRLVRPLLPFRRDELRAWLRGLGQGWREDPTNAAGNDRARIRHRILPLVREALRRDPAEPLARLAAAAAAAAKPAGAAGPRSAPGRTEGRTVPEPPRVTWTVEPAGNRVFLERLRAPAGEVELLDADAVRGELRTRAPAPGDRFRALGASRAQRLTHYLQRRGVPSAARAAVRVVCDDEGIVAVAGHGIAARVALTEDSRRVVVLRVAREGSTSPARRRR